MGNHHIERFLNNLAVNKQVSGATQNQALCAIMLLYRYIVKREIKGLSYSFTKREKALPTVLTHEETLTIINKLSGKYRLIASILEILKRI
jgi:site-specific recombinase XerD